MIFWLDGHISPDVAQWLGVRFKVVVKTLREIGLRDEDDAVVFKAGRQFGRIVIVTKDEDFAEFVRRQGSPPQLLWLRCGNLTTIELQTLLSRRFAEALAALERGDPIVEITN